MTSLILSLHCQYNVINKLRIKNEPLHHVPVRIDEQEKAETFKILNAMGIKPAQAVRLFFRQIRKTHTLPFPIEYMPNEKTAKTLLQSDKKKSYKRFDSVDKLFADLKK